MTQNITESTHKLITNAMQQAMTYAQYRTLVAELATAGKTTGYEQNEALIQYTQLNDRRMKRWDKTLKVSEGATTDLAALDKKMTWLVLTESWCGDASPALPVFHKITQINPNISLQIILRDQHLELMNRFLTNGAMSIPKLIAIEDTTGNVIGEWGPRSKVATTLVEAHKAEHGKILPEFKEDLQLWYNKDKGQSILSDLLQLFS